MSDKMYLGLAFVIYKDKILYGNLTESNSTHLKLEGPHLDIDNFNKDNLRTIDALVNDGVKKDALVVILEQRYSIYLKRDKVEEIIPLPAPIKTLKNVGDKENQLLSSVYVR